MRKLFKTILVCTLFFTINSCKKDKPKCGCNADEVKYTLKDISGSMSYYKYNQKWVLSYSPVPGNISNFFPCNKDHGSLTLIIQKATSDDVIHVKFSGKVKPICPSETFGIVSGTTTFDYIIIDSLKRN